VSATVPAKVSCGKSSIDLPSAAMEINVIQSRIDYIRCYLILHGGNCSTSDYENMTTQLDAIAQQRIYPGIKTRLLLKQVTRVERQFIDTVKPPDPWT